jgi:hypothetical protein
MRVHHNVATEAQAGVQRDFLIVLPGLDFRIAQPATDAGNSGLMIGLQGLDACKTRHNDLRIPAEPYIGMRHHADPQVGVTKGSIQANGCPAGGPSAIDEVLIGMVPLHVVLAKDSGAKLVLELLAWHFVLRKAAGAEGLQPAIGGHLTRLRSRDRNARAQSPQK